MSRRPKSAFRLANTKPERTAPGEDNSGTGVFAAYDWDDNGALIADVESLGYIHGEVLDATYGLGNFWTSIRPEGLVTNDLGRSTLDLDHHHDFTDFPEEWETRFDTVVFDPPYKLNGTPTPAADDRYGVGKRTTLKQRLDSIVNGSIECLRVTKAGGNLLVKVQDQVCSGRMHFQSDLVTQALSNTFPDSHSGRKVAQFHFLQTPRPQPKGRRQLHPSNNFSTLMVFKKEVAR